MGSGQNLYARSRFIGGARDKGANIDKPHTVVNASELARAPSDRLRRRITRESPVDPLF